jgi:hypothetical protein
MSQENSRNGRAVRKRAILGANFAHQHAEYRHAHAWGARIHALGQMSGFNSLYAQLTCTQAALELAGQASDDHERQALIERTLEAAEKTRELAAIASPHNQDKLRATRFLPNIPALLTLKALQEPVKKAQLQKAYDTHRAAITEQHRASAQTQAPTPQEHFWAEGEFAESFVLLSLQRYALEHVGDASWVPLPAVGHEDSTDAHGSVLQPTWDISIYTALADDETQTLAYKAQVKRQVPKEEERRLYAEDITMIHVRNDVAFRNEVTSEGRNVVSISRLMHEVAPDATAAQQWRWDGRTDLLLNILG